MDSLFEEIFGAMIEAIVDIWTHFMKKRNPDYDNSRSKKVLTFVVGIILILLSMALILGIFFLIEWKFPNLLDVVRYD